MNINDISSNSDAAREQAEEKNELMDYKPLEKVSVIARILGVFGIEPDISGAAGSVWEDVIKPTFLDGCRDSMYALADYFFGGGGGSSSRKSSGKGKDKHTNYSDKFKGSGRASKGKAPNSAVYYIPLKDRTEVLERLDQMWDVIRQSEFCSVQDCLTIFGKKTDNYTLGDWGWDAGDLKSVRPVRNSEGLFYLNLPKPKPQED